MSTSHFDASSDPPARSREPAKSAKPFLGIQYQCCQTYGRIYRNAEATAYHGACPRCGKSLRVPIGSGGTGKRFFTAG